MTLQKTINSIKQHYQKLSAHTKAPGFKIIHWLKSLINLSSVKITELR